MPTFIRMKLHYQFTNTGKPVALLLHGFLGSAAQWQEMVTKLNPQVDCLLVELCGHGNSVAHDGFYSMDDMVRALHGIILQEGIEQFHIVGHSMGGYLGAAFAKAYPEKTASLTLINSISGPDTAPRKLLRDRAIALIDKYQEAYVSMAVSNLFTDDERETFKQAISAMKLQANTISIASILQALTAMRDRSGVLLELEKATFPIHYISGEQDGVISQELILQEVELLRARHQSIDGGHMLIVTHAIELTNYLHFIE